MSGRTGSRFASIASGELWRIEPGPRPIASSIHFGVGISFVTFGDGAVWTGNYTDGTIARVDPRTRAVTVTGHFGPRRRSQPAREPPG